MNAIPLQQRHEALGAKMVPFAGFTMPIQYTGIKEEHQAVRTKCGFFDVSHMGEVFFRGPEAIKAVDGLITNDFASCNIGQAVYSALCHPNGGIVDDLIVYKLSETEALMCVNASNRDKDFAHIQEHVKGDVDVSHESDDWIQFAIQGPLAESIVNPLTSIDTTTIEYYHGKDAEVAGSPAFVSRTGYTGEDGFEIYAKKELGESIFDALRDAGGDDLTMCGLGCRDTLRLEAKYLLYGNDMNDDTNPFEAGLSWVVKLDKSTPFVGQEALREAKKKITRRLRTFVLEERGVLRPHYKIFDGDTEIGELTSGGFAPTLDKSIGLGYVDIGSAKLKSVHVEIRGKKLSASMGTKPFYKRETK